MDKFQIIIIGNGEPALACTISAKHTYSDKNLAIIKTDYQNSLIEEIFSAASGSISNALNIFYDGIKSRDRNILHLTSGKELEYEKLVLATGSRPIEPPIDGLNKKGVAFINQDPEQIRKIKKVAFSADRVVIFGGGYLGVELCDELLRLGKDVTLIEKNKRLMPSAFDSDVSMKVKNEIENLGGKVILGTKIKNILGLDAVTGIKLSSDELIECDFVMICCGSRPNVDIAEKLGVIFDRDRGVLVDEYFRTSDKDIFAVGECAAKFDFFTSDLSNVLMHNTKIEDAQLLGSNLFSVIFNRGKSARYASEATSFREKIKHELNEISRTNDVNEYISIPRF
jgi:NADH oxidase (H2O2-forming)